MPKGVAPPCQAGACHYRCHCNLRGLLEHAVSCCAAHHSAKEGLAGDWHGPGAAWWRVQQWPGLG
jgi:hypothetical protein